MQTKNVILDRWAKVPGLLVIKPPFLIKNYIFSSNPKLQITIPSVDQWLERYAQHSVSVQIENPTEHNSFVKNFALGSLLR